MFVIDKAGTLRQITINDLPVGRDVDETLRLVQVTFSTSHYLRLGIFTTIKEEQLQAEISQNVFQAFQFTDEHGEVCPAGWRPGEKGFFGIIFSK